MNSIKRVQATFERLRGQSAKRGPIWQGLVKAGISRRKATLLNDSAAPSTLSATGGRQRAHTAAEPCARAIPRLW
jgi:hypothetical protein